uniref:Uncharacterized protein n=1 Tax=Rangifer tarandus platyrhynchus TaxID=3082113 RepID=A0ACB0EVP3_RANTA|nr:unnamed protein product [Rangifer tarandus platyrhynchus]
MKLSEPAEVPRPLRYPPCSSATHSISPPPPTFPDSGGGRAGVPGRAGLRRGPGSLAGTARAGSPWELGPRPQPSHTLLLLQTRPRPPRRTTLSTPPPASGVRPASFPAGPAQIRSPRELQKRPREGGGDPTQPPFWGRKFRPGRLTPRLARRDFRESCTWGEGD